MSGGKLIVVPTPVGNLSDMTPRGLEVLKEAHAVLAEDTRTTGKLLRHFGVDTPLWAFHQHNEHRALTGVVQQLKGGVTLALCSDAGTPGISDPGFLLVRLCGSRHRRRVSAWCHRLCARIGDLWHALRQVPFRRFLAPQKRTSKAVDGVARSALHRGALREP